MTVVFCDLVIKMIKNYKTCAIVFGGKVKYNKCVKNRRLSLA